MWSIAFVFLASLIYAVVRYVAFAPKNLENLPVFVMNKGISTAAVICLMAAFILHWRQQRRGGKGADPGSWFRAGLAAAVSHIPLSLTILKPDYFPEFFGPKGRLHFGGEMVFLCGGLAAACFYLVSRPALTLQRRWLWSLAAMLVLFGHVLSMGLCRGLNINASHAYLPPMWLLSLLAIAVGLGMLLLAGRPAEPALSDHSKPTAGNASPRK